MIPYINTISFLALMMTTGLILKRMGKHKSKSLIALFFAFSLLMITELTNILEHFNIYPTADDWEDILEVVFIPLLILSLHMSLLEEELTKRMISEKKFSAIYNNATTFMGLLDVNGTLLDANEASLRFYKLQNPNEILGSAFIDSPWWAHSEVEKKKLGDALERARNGESCHFQTTHRGPDGNLLFVDFTLTPVFNDRNEVIYLIPEGRNVTELKVALEQLERYKNQLEGLVAEKTKELHQALETSRLLNEKLLQSNGELEERNLALKQQSDYLKTTLNKLKAAKHKLIESEKMASLGILTAGVAHEINNPLNYIMGGVTGLNQLASTHFGTNDHEIKELVNSIYSGIDRIANIVKSLNSYSRTNLSNIATCNVNEILDDCLVILRSKYRDRITIKKNYDRNAFIKAHEGRIHQVFLNVIHNAIQAINRKGEVEIKTQCITNQVITTITDTGIGISNENLSRITDPFFTTKPPHEGTGLGLSISQRIVSDYKGSIQFSSEPNQGTTVTIKFQLDQSSD